MAPTFETKLFINNEYVHAKSKQSLTIKNPYDDSTVSDNVELAGEDDVDLAVASATAALKTGPWGTFTGTQRAACMLKLADLMEQNAQELAYLESVPTGRPIATLLGFDIPHMVSCFRYYAGWADKIEGESFKADDGCYKIVQHEPLGVCAGLASWNASFLYVGWKIAPALAAGNAYIFKASEKSPLGVLALGKMVVEAGFPTGVVQLVSGDWKTGALLSSHMKIAKISMTGSLATGLKVQEQAAKSNLKRVTLELGGKGPAIVFNDADIPTALDACSVGFLFNSGQICAAASRVYVQDGIAESFIEGLKNQFSKSTNAMGANPLEMTTEIGPVVDQKQFNSVSKYIEKGRASATLIAGGGRKGTTGCFIEPTIFLNPAGDSPIYKEEIFGPVLVVKTFKTEEEVIELANDTTYGLAACVYTTNLDCALRMASKIDCGGVSINGPMMPKVQTPHGGFKQSGFGIELGKYGLMDYMKTKTIHVNMSKT